MAVELLNKVGANLSHWIGLSSDTKSVDCDYGSTFYEEDTSTPYIFTRSGWVVDYRHGEAVANKDTDATLAANSNTKYPSQKAIKTYVDALMGDNDALVYKGIIACAASPNYPAANAGHIYWVSTAGLIGGGSGDAVEVGDLLICKVDGSVAGTKAGVGANWGIIQANLNVSDYLTKAGSGEINALTDKTPPIDADLVLLEDSAAAAWTKKKLSWVNIKAALKTYFDGLYATLLGLSSQTAPAGTSLVGHTAGATVATLLDGIINRGVLSGLDVTDQDLLSGITIATEIKADLIRHAAVSDRHTTGPHSTVALAAVPAATDWQTLMTLAGALLTWYAAHNVDMIAVGPSYHSVTGTGHALTSAVTPTGITTCVARLNDLKAKYNLHEAETIGHADLGTVAGDEVAVADAAVTMHIHWSAGFVYDIASKTVKAIDAGGGACANNAINYLKWVSGATLTLGTAAASGDEVAVCRIDTFNSEIHIIGDRGLLNETLAAMRRATKAMFPQTVTSGCIVEPHGSGAGVLDVQTSGGIYFREGYEQVTVPAIDSNVANLSRFFRTATVWGLDYSAFVDPTQYDNGTNLVATAANKYYKSLFIIGHDKIHWIYPQVEHNTQQEAIAGAIPTIPAGLGMHLSSTALVLKGDATTLPALGLTTWIDVRPRIASTLAAVISDHGLLGGLADDDHPQYQLIPVQIHYTSATPWTPTPAVGTVGAEIRFDCALVDHDLAFGTPTGDPVNGQLLTITLISDATPRALDFTTCTAFIPVGVTLPTATVASKITTLYCRWNATRSKWLVYAVIQEL